MFKPVAYVINLIVCHGQRCSKLDGRGYGRGIDLGNVGAGNLLLSGTR